MFEHYADGEYYANVGRLKVWVQRSDKFPYIGRKPGNRSAWAWAIYDQDDNEVARFEVLSGVWESLKSAKENAAAKANELISQTNKG